MSSSVSNLQLPLIAQPPPFCEYAAGRCDQSFESPARSDALFLYPAEPQIIASTVEEALKRLKAVAGTKNWRGWKDLGVSGQIIFCQVCKALRFTRFVVADVTTLNFNLLFEIGYAIGLGIPVLPIRDTSYQQDARIFAELGLIDTLGYFDFQNSSDIVHEILDKPAPGLALPQAPSVNKEQPLYLMKSPIQSEGMVRLMSALKKSGLRFRAFDPKESARLSMHEAFKQIQSSLGVVVHLMAPNRAGATPHNSRCSFVAGLAMAAGKHVLMLQETQITQPIDYRDVIRCYKTPRSIPDLVIPFIKSVVGMLQDSRFVPTSLPLTPLEKVDLGDLAAENEILALRSYFVPTGQYNEAKRGHARLVVGRKGAGKTAIFYGIRSAYLPEKSRLVLDLKPEGHQFIKLREAVLNGLLPGLQMHVLTAFWNYLLLMEIAHKIVHFEEQRSYHDERLRRAYQATKTAYETYSVQGAEQGDFSERLLALVDEILKRKESIGKVGATAEVTQLIYRKDIRPLNDAIGEFVHASKKEDIWLLVDNLDKGWPIFDVKNEDIYLIKSLLEATRKLQRQFENRSVEFHAVVFLRNDIYHHLILDPADRGKDTAALLDWNDAETLKEMLRRRIVQSTGLDESFDELWRLFFVSHVLGEESFSYILARTLMRPREVLRFMRDCINVAVNRGHERVLEDDICTAERSYSEDALVDLAYELKDVRAEFGNAPYAFIGSLAQLTASEVSIALMGAGVKLEELDKVRELLLWFGFLGICTYTDEERYSYQFEHNVQKMMSGLQQFSYCIHPAFHKSLECRTP
jgi:hypothetical protein